MPPRKSNVSQVSATGDEGTPAKEKADGVNIEVSDLHVIFNHENVLLYYLYKLFVGEKVYFVLDLSLPRTMVQRLAKGVLPPNTQIQKDAILAMCKGATVFVNHIADKANELTLAANRKTITPLTTLEALAECEFHDFLPRVKAELDRFNEIATGKRNEYRRKIKEKETSAAVGGVNGAGGGEKTKHGDAGEEEEEEEEERARKRVRREEGGGKGGTPEEEEEEGEGEERYDTAMEDDSAMAADRRDSTQEGQEESEEEEDVSGDEMAGEEQDDEEEGDVERRVKAVVPDGMSSGVDDDDDDDGSEESE
ncbi:MAG: hypothetical protein L6R40_001210 [Gallowayella cf. fulva]|nr:MAG: hypothetical protein L6R40_001210 [Xanthomendoza cf. fulva]